MAKRLGVSKATISRELQRGKVILIDSQYREYEGCSAMVAQDDYDYNATTKGPPLKIGSNSRLAKHIEELIVEDNYSPYAAIEKMKLEAEFEKQSLCWRTIYNYIEKDIFERLHKDHLPRKGKTSKRKYSQVKRRIRDPEAKRIDDHPEAAKDRSEFGHWEMDCIESSRKKITGLSLSLSGAEDSENIVL